MGKSRGTNAETKNAYRILMGECWKINVNGMITGLSIVHEEFVLAGQTVNSAYHCGVLRRLRENL
jgi:hypothetical protein